MEYNEGRKGIKSDIKKYFLRNNYTLVFSILGILSLLFFIAKTANINLGIGVLNQIVDLFPKGIWILLLLSFIISFGLSYIGKYKWIFLPVFIWLLIFTAQFRTVNVPQLIDPTTGNYTLGPDLDPFLYLRLAGEINNGVLPKIDSMRYADTGATNYARLNLMPWAIYGFYKFLSIFTNTSITYAAIILPVVLFLLSLIAFFLFVKTIASFKTDNIKSSLIALIASIFYAVSPEMLHRTTGGIPEIESLGMVFFWLTFLFFILAWKSENKKKWIIFGIISGLFTGLMSFSWGGYRFIYIILALTAFVIFFLGKDVKKNIIIFSSWFIPALIIEFAKVKSIVAIISGLSGTGAAVIIFVLLILQAIFLKTKLKEKFKKINIPDSLKILILCVILGILALLIVNPKLIVEIPSTIIHGLLYPFGTSRTGLTVAENKAPYLNEAIQQFGYVFWLFLASILLIFYESVKHFDKKNRIKLILSFIILIACLTFTRISQTNIFNGENAISTFVYFAGITVFGITALNVAYKYGEDSTILENFKKVDFSYILLISFSFWAIVSIRGAVRLFFIVSPMMILVFSFLSVRLYELMRKSREELFRLVLIVLLILSLFAISYSFLQDSSSSIAQSKSTVPGIYEQQWQKAMSWTRENTAKGSVFVHWWDYGYWVQTIGERPTVTDGGHYIPYWDHLTGRYVLTTPIPGSALSFMKTHDVSYLLIDSTDLGKYSAYSSIGSDNTGQDRFSFIPVMPSIPSQTLETKDGTKIIYSGGYGLDSDIIYEENGTRTLLSMQKTGVAGIILEYSNTSIKQPQIVFVQNGNQLIYPLRYVYDNNKLYDFGSGVNATIMIIPSVVTDSTGKGGNVDLKGAAIYLSNKTMNGLFAQLYLMNDPLNKYPTVKVAHVEQDIVVDYFNSQFGANLEFIYYNGFRGPIKIWKVDYPENIIEREEFSRNSGDYAEFDNLTFVK